MLRGTREKSLVTEKRDIDAGEWACANVAQSTRGRTCGMFIVSRRQKHHKNKHLFSISEK